MNINDVISYSVTFFILFLLVRPVFSGVVGGGRGKYGVESPAYSRENPSDAPMYYFLTIFQLIVVGFVLWGIFGDHKTSQPSRPTPVFINELTDSSPGYAVANSSKKRASANLKSSHHQNQGHKHKGKKSEKQNRD